MDTLLTTQPFHIGISQAVLDDLRARLTRTRRTRVLRKAGWEAGSDPDYLDELLRYWRDDYDWRTHEHALNHLSHFIARIGDASVHFVHETGLGAKPAPLLLLHGWPDSFLRYRGAIPYLTGVRDMADGASFDVVIPSLPGFAFTGLVPPASEVPGIEATARLMHRLMTEVLGYREFLVAGGDGGSAIAQSMAIQFPESIVGVHLTDIGWYGNTDPASLSDIERKYVEAAKRGFMEDGAYAMVQASRPRALAAALNDSPAGLASWIVDRFHSWAASPRQLEDSLSRDEILTNITIYWVTQTIQSSIYGYLEETRHPSLRPGSFVERPVGLALFPKDLAGPPPRRLAERTLNVVRWTEMTRGGHFGAWEFPREYAAELTNFLVSLEDMLITQPRHEHRTQAI